MTPYDIWLNVMANIAIVFVPILVLAAGLIVVAFKISDEIKSNPWAATIIIASILLTAAFGVAWIQALAMPCGYLERHFPVQDHIEGHCDDVG